MDAILKRYADQLSSWDDRRRLGAMPVSLGTQDIAELWSGGTLNTVGSGDAAQDRRALDLFFILRKAIEEGSLATSKEVDGRELITKDAFYSWLRDIGEPVPDFWEARPCGKNSKASESQRARHSRTREDILSAAVYCLANFSAGKVTAVSLAELIDQKSNLFWPSTGAPPLSRRTIEDILGKALRAPAD